MVAVQEAIDDPVALPETLTGDKGYFSLLEIGRLQELSLKTVISDPRRARRRFDKLSSAQRQSLARAQRSVSSQYGRRLLRKRGQHIELELCPCARRRRDAADHLAETGKPQQTSSDSRRVLQSLPTPAMALRNRHSEAVGGLSLHVIEMLP